MDIGKVRIVVVEPEYQINLGYIARAARNFGIKRLFLVNPKCRHDGKEAIKYSKHAHALLERARICGSISEATSGTALRVGTTSLPFKAANGMHNICSAKRLPALLKGKGSASLLIGREGIGLRKEELADCDAVVVIPASKDYPTLNISHALAILLYELFPEAVEPAAGEETRTEIGRIVKLFGMGLKERKEIRDKEAVKGVFEHIIRRANPSKRELRALAAAISINKKEKKK